MFPGAKIIKSPNHSSRAGARVRMIVLHYTADSGGAVSWFKKREARVSSHYVVLADGQVIQMVDLDRAAWHAGQPPPRYEEIKPNRSSVGIEVVNWGLVTPRGNGFVTCADSTVPKREVVRMSGHYWQRYAAPALASLIELVAWLCEETGIPTRFMFEGQRGFERRGRRYRKVPYYLPAGRPGTHSCLATWRFKDNAGICGHCHITSAKDDPGPHLPWERVLGITAS